ncbi:MAG: enoyl-CoA hydratase/isomerase family protein [Sulfitobacter sp.]|nr:enoyl-CoA hydratase/isomerase family protein [Sulfitobacter sp.]
MENNLIKTRIEDHVAIVTLSNPPVNAQSREFMEELVAVFDELNETVGVRCIILTGEGKCFSAGADIKMRAKMAAEAQPGDTFRHLRRAREVGFVIMESNIPVIAAVNGPALGAGMGIAIMCDLIVASTKAVFGLPEIDIGLMGGVRHTMRVFPLALTRRMVLTGWRVPAEELYRRGLIEECVEPDDLMPTALEMARNIASKSPKAVRLAKRALNTVETMGLKDGYRFEQNLTVEMSGSEDGKEAMKAFMEKRPAEFKDEL